MTAPDVRTCCPTMKGQHHTCERRARRGASNRDTRGSSATRRIRRQWLVQAFKADVVRILVRQKHRLNPNAVSIGDLIHDTPTGFVREHDPEAPPYLLPEAGYPLEGCTIPAWDVWSIEVKPDQVSSILESYKRPPRGIILGGVTIAMVAVVEVCRCYRCGKTLDDTEVSPDKIHLQADGGGYARHNIRPCCLPCQSSTGGQAGAARKAAKVRNPRGRK